jgi:hypothetical protein
MPYADGPSSEIYTAVILISVDGELKVMNVNMMVMLSLVKICPLVGRLFWKIYKTLSVNFV